jgi:hypothetical protein
VKLIDRAIVLTIALVVAAAVLPAVVAPLTTLLVVATLCFIAIQAARSLTDRW